MDGPKPQNPPELRIHRHSETNRLQRTLLATAYQHLVPPPARPVQAQPDAPAARAVAPARRRKEA
jgi:hypothetical protein